MFLFKKTKSLAKRIGMNMVVYGYIGFMVFLMISSAFPEIFENCKRIVSAVFSFVFIVGLVVTVVCVLAELFRNITKGQKQKNKLERGLSSDKCKVADNSQSAEAKNGKAEKTEAEYDERQATLKKQLDNIDVIIDRVLRKRKFVYSADTIEGLRDSASNFVKQYIDNERAFYTFYWSEYPMGAIHNRLFIKDNGIWCVSQYDFDKKPKENITQYPEINDENFLEHFLEVLLNNEYNKEKKGEVIKAEDSSISKRSYTGKPDIKLGECYNEGFTEQYISLRKDEKGYFIYENLWHYNANKEECIGTTYIDFSYIAEGNVKRFVDFLKKQYPDYEIDRYVKDNKELCKLFLSDAISILADFLRNNGYDIKFACNEMSVVKQSDDPWNHFNKFIVKPDGVYNFVEVQMGGYSLIKRLSCSNYKVASFVVLSYFIVSNFSLRDSADDDMQMILRVIKEHIDYVLRFTMDYDRGQWFIDILKKEVSVDI